MRAWEDILKHTLLVLFMSHMFDKQVPTEQLTETCRVKRVQNCVKVDSVV